jgi:hypothetical protein
METLISPKTIIPPIFSSLLDIPCKNGKIPFTYGDNLPRNLT